MNKLSPNKKNDLCHPYNIRSFNVERVDKKNLRITPQSITSNSRNTPLDKRASAAIHNAPPELKNVNIKKMTSVQHLFMYQNDD